jgi:phospholipase DDHD2
VSLRTIPQLRQFANDNLMDVLYFMSPEHHDIIIDIVVNEMNFVAEKFRRLTGFSGDISLVGHSLGSIISWDILDNQRKVGDSKRQPRQYSDENGPSDVASEEKPKISSTGSECLESGTPEIIRAQPNQLQSSQREDTDPQSLESRTAETDGAPSSEREAPESSTPVSEEDVRSTYPQLDFKVDNAFMLGSPIAVFLMIRNQRKPLSPDFSLSGCSRIFNIFHPYDPVAYRIEPLIHPSNAEIDPKIMPHCKSFT